MPPRSIAEEGELLLAICARVRVIAAFYFRLLIM